MTKLRLKQFLLLITAMIWGFAFVAQDRGMDYVDPFTFNASRSIIASIVILISIVFIKKFKKKEEIILYSKAKLIEGGLVTGIFLFFGMNLQQFGIIESGAGMSGFITTLYILFVPLIGLLFKRKIDRFLVLCIMIAVIGLYLINYTNEQIVLSTSIILLLGCAIAYAFQISAIDYYSKLCDSYKLTFLQFVVAGIFSFICMMLFEEPRFSSILAAYIPILYVGILSSGVAFTIQTIAQKDVNPIVASLIMSLESLFAAIGGFLILNERFTILESLGCLLIFLAIILSQIPRKSKKKITI